MYEIFKFFKALVENLSGKKINILTIENGKDNVNNSLQNICEDNGIQMKHSVPYTPQQNGVAERKNRALKEMATCMLGDKYLSPNIWQKTINCDSCVYNIFSHK